MGLSLVVDSFGFLKEFAEYGVISCQNTKAFLSVFLMTCGNIIDVLQLQYFLVTVETILGL